MTSDTGSQRHSCFYLTQVLLDHTNKDQLFTKGIVTDDYRRVCGLNVEQNGSLYSGLEKEVHQYQKRHGR